jgi:hypothetical protein
VIPEAKGKNEKTIEKNDMEYILLLMGFWDGAGVRNNNLKRRGPKVARISVKSRPQSSRW